MKKQANETKVIHFIFVNLIVKQWLSRSQFYCIKSTEKLGMNI